MQKSLVALDTNHIKEYVFGTNKLKEIRGASSILDYLNRVSMKEKAQEVDLATLFDERRVIYANGGSGLFLIDVDKADHFGQMVQGAFREATGGGATVTYFIQKLPSDAPDDIDELLDYPLGDTLELMRYCLQEAKDSPADITRYDSSEKDRPADLIALPSHPFMRLCDACGVEYASPDEKRKKVSRDSGEENELYCVSCQKKRRRDADVKQRIEWHLDPDRSRKVDDEFLWVHLIDGLLEKQYRIPSKETDRPHDFNVFRNFKGAKDYLGLIYADANSMGRKIEACETLRELKEFAGDVDEAIYEAACLAIAKHLKIEDHLKPKDELVDTPKNPLFPFDMLLLGGDDVMMVVPASVAMDVALTIAKEFHRLTIERASKRKEQAKREKKEPSREKQRLYEPHTLSVGVVLSPINYPFGLLQELVRSTLKSAKTEGAKKEKDQTGQKSEYGNTLINFMTVTGSTSLDFKQVYKSLSEKDVPVSVDERSQKAAFYATLRPYTPEQLKILLDAIREGNKLGLGRSKLHQVREAVLKKNLTTSVSDGLAVLRNWRTRQRDYVVNHIYNLGGIYQMTHRDEQNPASIFPRVTFPWFADGKRTYRTSLLDFVELFDFVAREEEVSDAES